MQQAAAVIGKVSGVKRDLDGAGPLQVVVNVDEDYAQDAREFQAGSNVAIAAIYPVDLPAPGKPFEANYSALVGSGFFTKPQVVRAVGSDEKFLEWVRRQNCVVTGKKNDPDWVSRDTDPVVAAHVRRVAAGAGTGIKPEYSAVPLVNSLHRLQHNKGESAVMPKGRWDELANKTLEKWCSETLLRMLAESLAAESPGGKGRAVCRVSGFVRAGWACMPPNQLLLWAEQRELQSLIPSLYFHA